MKKPILGVIAALATLSAAAQTSNPDPVPAPRFNTMYGDVARVVTAKPVKEGELPQRECRVENAGGGSDAAPEIKRCEEAGAKGDRVVAYDVTYEYNGRQFSFRMPYDPGEQMPVNVDVRPPISRPPAWRGNQAPQNPRYRGT